MPITVGSQRRGSLSPPLGAVVIRIDRASVLGNPFDMGNDERLRPAVVEAHEAWLDVLLKHPELDAVRIAALMANEVGLKLASAWKRPTAEAIIRELYRIGQLAQTQEVWLMCWCSPAACHGDAYKAVIESGLVEVAQPPGWVGQEMPSTEQPLPPKPALNPLAAVKPNSPGVLPHLERDRIVAAAATQFIGYSARDERYASMTRKYQQAWAEIDRANTGVYSPKDLIMVSGSGQWGCVTVQQIQQTFNEQVVPLLNLAIAVRARFIVGNASGNDRLVRQHLEGKGYRAVVGIAGYLEFSPPPKEQESINQVREAAPAYIAELAPNQVFVFGSNTEGRHGKGAALTAFGTSHPKRKGAAGKWAIYGQARGLMQGREGMSYGIVTKDLSRGSRSIPLAEIEAQIVELLAFAGERTDLEFLVTPFGTALAGYSSTDIAGLWQGKTVPGNVRLPQAWLNIIGRGEMPN